jgi:hypothetical protein
MTSTATVTYTLTGVKELREYDEGIGCYMPLPSESKIACAHCGKLCSKLYEVTRDQDGASFLIGPSCCKKNLFGWEPEKEVAKQMEKAADKLAKNNAHQKLVAIAEAIAQEVAALAIPEIEYLGTKYSSQSPYYGIKDTNCWVVCRDGILTDERRHSCIASWQRGEIRKRIEVTNERTRQKIQEIAEAELTNLR